MREEVEVTDLAKCWKGRELEAPEKLSERANFESPAARPALRNSKAEKLSENVSEKLSERATFESPALLLTLHW